MLFFDWRMISDQTVGFTDGNNIFFKKKQMIVKPIQMPTNWVKIYFEDR